MKIHQIFKYEKVYSLVIESAFVSKNYLIGKIQKDLDIVITYKMSNLETFFHYVKYGFISSIKLIFSLIVPFLSILALFSGNARYSSSGSSWYSYSSDFRMTVCVFLYKDNKYLIEDHKNYFLIISDSHLKSDDILIIYNNLNKYNPYLRFFWWVIGIVCVYLFAFAFF